jgi:hypothetical protein
MGAMMRGGIFSLMMAGSMAVAMALGVGCSSGSQYNLQPLTLAEPQVVKPQFHAPMPLRPPPSPVLDQSNQPNRAWWQFWR